MDLQISNESKISVINSLLSNIELSIYSMEIELGAEMSLEQPSQINIDSINYQLGILQQKREFILSKLNDIQ